MVDCLRNGPSIYDHYDSDMMKTFRQVITLNTTQAPVPPRLSYSLLLIRNLQPVRPYSLSHSDSMGFDFSVQLERVPTN